MKYPVALEFKETILYSDPGPRAGFVPLIYNFPHLTTAYPRPGSPPGSDREICRTVNGVVRLELLDSTPGSEFWATACLMGAYGGMSGVIQQHTFGPSAIGVETTGVISTKNPTSSEPNLYSTANMSAGAYGFDYFSSYYNLTDSIFIRLEIMNRNSEFAANAKFLVSGFLLAGDPA